MRLVKKFKVAPAEFIMLILVALIAIAGCTKENKEKLNSAVTSTKMKLSDVSAGDNSKERVLTMCQAMQSGDVNLLAEAYNPKASILEKCNRYLDDVPDYEKQMELDGCLKASEESRVGAAKEYISHNFIPKSASYQWLEREGDRHIVKITYANKDESYHDYFFKGVPKEMILVFSYLNKDLGDNFDINIVNKTISGF